MLPQCRSRCSKRYFCRLGPGVERRLGCGQRAWRRPCVRPPSVPPHLFDGGQREADLEENALGLDQALERAVLQVDAGVGEDEHRVQLRGREHVCRGEEGKGPNGWASGERIGGGGTGWGRHRVGAAQGGGGAGWGRRRVGAAHVRFGQAPQRDAREHPHATHRADRSRTAWSRRSGPTPRGGDVGTPPSRCRACVTPNPHDATHRHRTRPLKHVQAGQEPRIGALHLARTCVRR